MTGEVTIASRDVDMNGVAVQKGAWLGLADGKAVAGGADFDDVAAAVAERLLEEPRDRDDAPHRRGRARPRRLLDSDPASAIPIWSSKCRPAASRTIRCFCPLNNLGPLAEPIRLVLVEDNQVFREALELLLGLQSDIVVVASVGDGSSAAERRARAQSRCRADGLPAARARRRAGDDGPCAKRAPTLPSSASRRPRTSARSTRSSKRAPLRACRRTRSSTRSSRRSGTPPELNLTAENTAIVLDSTADFPEAPDRFQNWRVVPLYVLFGDESYRDYVELTPQEFYARLRTAAELPTTSQPTPGDFLTTYEELRGYDRIYSLHISSALSGTYQSATDRGGGARRQGARHRLRDRVRGDRDARRSRSSADSSAGRPTTRSTRSSARFKAEARPALHRRHARVPAARRTHRPRERVGREPFARQADPHDRARGRSAEARARQPEGDCRNSCRSSRSTTQDTPTLKVGIAHAEAPERAEQLQEDGRAERPHARGRDRDDARCGRRNARRAGHRRVLLVRRLPLVVAAIVLDRARDGPNDSGGRRREVRARREPPQAIAGRHCIAQEGKVCSDCPCCSDDHKG